LFSSSEFDTDSSYLLLQSGYSESTQEVLEHWR